MKKNNSGFALFAVVVLLAVVSGAVALALDEAVSSIQDAGRYRVSEMIKAGVDHGMNLATRRLQDEDVAALADPASDWDIFAGPAAPGSKEFVGPIDFPPTGEYANEFRVRIGLRPGQRTRAPEGEDVTKAYGQIVELQVSVDTNGTGAGGTTPPAEERVTVGVLIPRTSAHAQ